MAKGLVLFLTFGIVAVAFGQTSADLSAKYRPITAYELRADVVMTPKYATDGQVCEIAIERRQKTETGIVFATPFSEDEVRHFIDELAPEGERGRNLTKTLNERVDVVSSQPSTPTRMCLSVCTESLGQPRLATE